MTAARAKLGRRPTAEASAAPRVLGPSDIGRLRDEALTRTHLARYERANDRGARRVLDEPCPEPLCGAGPGIQCYLSGG